MNRFVSALILLAATGCNAGAPGGPGQNQSEVVSHTPVNASLGEPVELHIGQEARVASESLTLLFDSVLEDSRCPEDLQCVWAGNAKVRIEATKAPHTRETLHLNTGLDLSTGEAGPLRSFLNYEIELLNLAPGTADRPIAPERYVARLIVTTP